MSWYQRSHQDHDTHRGAMTRGGVVALCGAQFEPLTIAAGGKALRGQPPDPGQVCPECLRKVSP